MRYLTALLTSSLALLLVAAAPPSSPPTTKPAGNASVWTLREGAPAELDQPLLTQASLMSAALERLDADIVAAKASMKETKDRDD